MSTRRNLAVMVTIRHVTTAIWKSAESMEHESMYDVVIDNFIR